MNKTDSISNLKQLIERSALKFGDKVALQIKRDKKWVRYSFQDIWERVETIGGQLRSLGIDKGDRVAIISENCPEWGIAYLSIVSAGITAVPIDCKLPKEIILHLIEFVGARAVFSSREFNKIFEEQKNLLVFEIEKLGTQLEELRLAPHLLLVKELPEPEISKDAIASIIFTSGTTGTPKGVMLTHYNFISDVLAVDKGCPIFPADNILSILPLHHVFEFTLGFLLPLHGGGTISYTESLSSVAIMENMLETGTSAMAAVPRLYEIFYQRIVGKIQELPGGMQRLLGIFIKINRLLRLITGRNMGKIFFTKIHKGFGGKIRLLVSGGAKLELKVARFFQDVGFNLIEGYGITEASPVVSANLIEDNKIGSVGRPLPGIQVEIDRPDHNGVGEIKVKGPIVMAGYFKNESATREVVRGGWFYTGDLGYLDKKGYLYITGRKKDVIVTSAGKNIYPEDVEAYYAKLPGISELCAFGHTTEEGEGVFAAVIPDKKYFAGKENDEIRAEIEKRFQERSKSIPSYERIRSFVIWEGEFPKTSLNKSKRFKIKEDCAKYFVKNKDGA